MKAIEAILRFLGFKKTAFKLFNRSFFCSSVGKRCSRHKTKILYLKTPRRREIPIEAIKEGSLKTIIAVMPKQAELTNVKTGEKKVFDLSDEITDDWWLPKDVESREIRNKENLVNE